MMGLHAAVAPSPHRVLCSLSYFLSQLQLHLHTGQSLSGCKRLQVPVLDKNFVKTKLLECVESL